MADKQSTDFRWHRRALDCIAQGALTNSKRPECHVKGVYPTHLQKGQGCYVWDMQGRKYMDFITGLGTNLLGYGETRVNGAIAGQLQHGACLSLGTHHEIEAAEMIKGMFPFVDAVKFLKTGTEACAAAARIARAKTGRDMILSDGYHGWSDDFVSLTDPAVGVPRKDPYQRAIKRLSDESATGHRVAAVIVEPVITDWSDDRRKYLTELRDECTKLGTILIFDEVITGFRFPRYGVTNYWGITPDIICLGKAVANGMPLAVVGGKYDVMNCDEYFVSSSYAGETLSLVAAKETMSLLQKKYDLDGLWAKGQKWLDEFNSIAPDVVKIEGYPTRGVFKGDPLAKALFFQEACLAGILFGPSWFFNFPLSEDAFDIMGSLKEILGKIRRGEVKLKGEPPRSPFAEKVRAKQ